MIDPKKSVVIFSHPRSGSTWFQKSLPQFNLSELFLLRLQFNGETDRGIRANYLKQRPVYNDVNAEMQYRFKLYTEYASTRPVSVKTHTFLSDDIILDFLKKQDAQFVLLNRRNKLDTFWSALISWHTLNWHQEASTTPFTANKLYFDSVVDWLKKSKDECVMIRNTFDVQEHYYEDFIHYPKSDWFNPAPVLVQNAKAVTPIVNREEVEKWLEEVDFSSL